MAYAPQANEPELMPLGQVQRRLLDAGRILVTGGWLVLNYSISSNRAANAVHGLIGLLLLLLGVFLGMLVLVANQFPGVARAAAAMADAVLFYFLAPANQLLGLGGWDDTSVSLHALMRSSVLCVVVGLFVRV